MFNVRIPAFGWLLLLCPLALALAAPNAAAQSVERNSTGPETQGQGATLGRSEVAPGVVVEIKRLARLPNQNAVELRFEIVNARDDRVPLETTGVAARIFNGGPFHVSGVRLLDRANGVEYQVGRASAPLTSRWREEERDLRPLERRSAWAWFGAPPAGVTTMTVFVGGAPPILDVPLSRP